jgi:PAS domain S-box-containing protein
MNKSQQKPLSAERRIILVFVMSTVASIVLVGGGLNFFLQRAVLAQSRTHLESMANLLARQCESEITEARLDLEFMSKLLVFQQLPYIDKIDRTINGVPENVEVEKRQLLTQLMNKTERFSSLFVLRPNGDFYLAHPFRTQMKFIKHNLSDRSYFQEALRTGKTAISGFLVGASGNLSVAIIVPILDKSGEVSSYLGGTFYLNRLSRLVARERIRPFDAGFIVDKQGQLIAHTDTTLLREGIRDHFTEHHQLLARFITSAVTTAGAMQPVALFGECMDSTSTNSHLTALVPLISSGWTLGLSREKAAALAEVRPVIWGFTALAGLLLAIIGGFGVALAHGIGRRWDKAERALRASEELLKTSEERFRTAAENLSDVVYDWDIKEKVDWYGDIDGITGYPPGGFPRTIEGWAATIHPEDKDRVMAALESHLKNKAPYVIEYRVGRKDGEWRWWSARGTALRDDRDEPYKMIGSISDITERKNAGEALRESEAKYRTLVENIPQKILMKDRNYRWVSINENLARDFGFRPEEVVGKADADLFSPELAAKYHADDVRIMDTGKTEDIEEKYIQEGKETWVNTIKTPVRDASGVIVGVLGVFWDITERKRAGEALERIRVDLARSNKELEQFAYVASHDLQEPLRMVSSYTQLLAQKYEGQLDEKAKKYINYAVDGAVRMQRLINDLLTYSRIGTRGKPSELIDSHSVLGEALRNLAATIEENRAVITNEDLPMVRADESQLMQVFQNLIANAIKFRQEEIPRVHISVREQEHEWVFSVKDNGIGIDPKYSGRLFVIFQRLHTKEEYPGTGIGLAVCKRIVERHGGRIWFESELGKGTTFYFTIPKKE